MQRSLSPHGGPLAPEDPPGWIGPQGPLGPHPGLGSGARLWIVRHGEVDQAARGRAYGSDDVPLAPEGRQRSLELALSLARLAPARIYSSSLERARYLGAATAAACGAPLTIDAGLAEVNRGAWQQLEVADLHRLHSQEVDAFHRDPWNFRGHGGESDHDVAARAWPIVSAAAKGHPGANLIFVCHYNVARCLCTLALGLPPARSFALRLDKARALLLEDRPAGFKLAALNLFDPGAFLARDEHLGARP